MKHTVLGAAVAAVLGIAAAGMAVAQTPPTVPNAKTAKSKPQTLQAVEVTGTHITSAQLATEIPVQTVTAAQIQKSGLATVGDVLRHLSMSGASLTTNADNPGNVGTPPSGTGIGAGSTTLALRNLGASRTLILLNGQRFINGSSGSGVSDAVDLNTLPAGIISRITILTNGASAIYGSSAIGGVVNIITKTRQQGAAIHAYLGSYSMGGTTHNESLSFGGQGNKYDFFVSASHYNQDGILASHWPRGATAVVQGSPNNLSSTTIPPRIAFTAPSGDTFNGLCPDGVCDIAANASNVGGSDFPRGFHQFGTSDLYDYGSPNTLLTPSKRSGLFTSVHYHLGPNVTLYFNGLASTRQSLTEAAPDPMTFGPATAQIGTLGAQIPVSSTNPYNPLGFTLSPSDPNYGIQRRNVEEGLRYFSQRVETRYFQGGVNGEFSIGSHDMNWDLNLIHGTNDATQENNEANYAHLKLGLGALSMCQAVPGCVPINIFGGPGSFTPAMVNYVYEIEQDSSHQGLTSFTGDLSGELVKLPEGWVNYAVGFSHNDMSGWFHPGVLNASGDSGGLPTPPTQGTVKDTAAYVEFNVPLLTQKRFAKRLDVDLASRYSKYHGLAGTTSSQVGIHWLVNNSLTLRGTWGQGFRAPGIGELFTPRSSFNAQIIDPCNSNSPVASPQVAANCRALGVPNPASFHQNNEQINITTGGNPDLQPERSRESTLGFVYSPTWVNGTPWASDMSFSVTYYNIGLKGAVGSIDPQTILNNCALTLSIEFCALQQRSAAGFLSIVDDRLDNLNSIHTSGFDVNVKWASKPTPVGRFDVNWGSTYTSSFKSVTPLGVLTDQTVGVEEDTSGIPRWRSNFRVGWEVKRWSASWTIRYLSPLVEGCSSLTGIPFCNLPPSQFFPEGTHKMGGMIYNDMRLSWSLPTEVRTTMSAGVNNIFNHQPPMCLSCINDNYDTSLYDFPSRFYYIEGTVTF
ncbi:MAG TPA: TonB-dependent receptor [Rhodanobacteraceae bacterium]